jgi:RNA recognition motif-containing protein
MRNLSKIYAVHVQIEETNLFPDKATGSAKGCGFVTFKSQEQAQNAMNALSGALTLQVRLRTPCAGETVGCRWQRHRRRCF